MEVYFLDYGAGNVRSIINAIEKCGARVVMVQNAADFERAERLVFPGVGSFGACMERLEALGFVAPLKAYLASQRPFLGICLGMQTLFAASEESPGVPGLGLIPGTITRFTVDASAGLAVPHMGWNGLNVRHAHPGLFGGVLGAGSSAAAPGNADGSSAGDARVYFVHSFKADVTPDISDWVLTTTDYGQEFVSSVQRGNVMATQFHPEKSGSVGLDLFRRFLELPTLCRPDERSVALLPVTAPTRLAPRVIACLDVRTNDHGDLVVTKGDQYDVREKEGAVRNLGKPVALAQQYYEDGADEITFLNITSFRNSPLRDQPMLEVLRETSKNVFVPLTIGGGIRDTVDPDGTPHSALEVASEYFRSGADKVSIGSDAVLIAEEYIRTGQKTGKTSIETISHVYGRQAVVISVDPKRVYVKDPSDVKHHTFPTKTPGPNGEAFCWLQCTIKGGREARDLGAYELVRACEALGAGEILLNCMDKDGTNSGYDLEFINDIKGAVSIPVIASSGAGCAEHFYEVFTQTKADAALAAGIFHRREVPLPEVKDHLVAKGIPVRPNVAK